MDCGKCVEPRHGTSAVTSPHAPLKWLFLSLSQRQTASIYPSQRSSWELLSTAGVQRVVANTSAETSTSSTRTPRNPVLMEGECHSRRGPQQHDLRRNFTSSVVNLSLRNPTGGRPQCVEETFASFNTGTDPLNPCLFTSLNRSRGRILQVPYRNRPVHSCEDEAYFLSIA